MRKSLYMYYNLNFFESCAFHFPSETSELQEGVSGHHKFWKEWEKDKKEENKKFKKT